MLYLQTLPRTHLYKQRDPPRTMMRRLLLVALCLSCTPPSAQAFVLTGRVPGVVCLRLSAPAETGELVFSANRAACHAGGTHAVAAAHTPEKAAIEKYLTGGFTEKAVASQIKHGKNAMPLFAERLSEAEIGLVAAYVMRSAEDGWE